MDYFFPEPFNVIYILVLWQQHTDRFIKKKWDFSHSCDSLDFLSMVVHFKINSFWNGEFSLYCLYIFLPFLRGF